MVPVDRPHHAVELYESDTHVVGAIATHIGPAVAGDDAAVVVATDEHRRAVDAALTREGIDVAGAVARGRYVVLDAAATLASFMTADGPDPLLFRDAVGRILESAGAGGRRVQVYGEMVALLWEAGDIASVLALEDLWNDLADDYRFDLLCAYPMRLFTRAGETKAFRRMCEQHGEVVPAESWPEQAGEDQRRRAAALLQQEARVLRADVERLQEQQRLLSDLAYLDPLTGLANRRAFDRTLEREWETVTRDGVETLVVVADLDGFKAYNDRHGHRVGDEALRAFAAGLRVATRRADVVARLGGDEFGALLVRCRPDAFAAFERRLDAALASALPSGELSASLGHASLSHWPSGLEALDAADQMMFAAKRRLLESRSEPARERTVR